MTENQGPQVVVIGGGPAGSTVATLLAQQGINVELFEREVFPRFHIGESLIPETYWVLERLKMLDKMKRSHFVKKHSVQFVNASGRSSTPFYFHDNKPHECSATWQVLRSEFDEMMLMNAQEQGVKVHQGARVRDVLFEGERAVGIEVTTREQGTRKILADVVVDASGQSSMIINRFGLRVSDPQLNKGAIWTYFEGAYRDTGRDEGATLVLQTHDKQGWFWYIPQHDNRVSVGVVGDFDYLFKNRGDHEQTYLEELDRCPSVKERVSVGRRASRYYATKDYTYRSSRASGDGWVLVGDAFGFLDPLYSSGVLLALKSGELAADSIVEGLAKGDTSRAQLGKWEADYVRGMNRMRRLVCEYYDGFSFGRFVRRFPHLRGAVTDLLIGDLFKEELDTVFESIDLMRSEALNAQPT
ncbi:MULTISPECIES: NAD(P)/FAD-dependent oxidoreductase [unclassified Schlesneria]|uniref:NAD(P)/FAD-dependent oxidoreductase n=1 Tax=Schlesneria TaxID=656899 RepID=UPI0035A00B4F